MPRPKRVNAGPPLSVPQRHAALLRREGNRMHNESIRLENESKLLLQAADVLEKEPLTPRNGDVPPGDRKPDGLAARL